MDTRWKNIKTSPWAKLIALLLTAVLLFCSGFYASLFLRSVLLYNCGQANSFVESYAFHDLMSAYERAILSGAEQASVTSYDEWLKTDQGSGMEKNDKIIAEKINAAFDLLDGSGLDTFVTDDNRWRYALDENGDGVYDVYFNYQGTVISKKAFESLQYSGFDPEEIADADDEDATVPTRAAVLTDESGKAYVFDPAKDAYVPVDTEGTAATTLQPQAQETDGLNKQTAAISQALYYLDSLGGDTCYGLASRETLLERYTMQKDNWSKPDTNAPGTGIRANDASAHYAVFVSSTGNLVTNCGVTKADSEAEILAKLGGAYAESWVNGVYTRISGEQAQAAHGLLGNLHDALYGSSDPLELLQGDGIYQPIERAYFSYTPSNAEDAFTLAKLGYDDFSARSAQSPAVCLVLACVLFLLACICGIWLSVVSGETAQGVRVRWFDKIPLLFRAAVLLGISACFIALLCGICFVSFYAGETIYGYSFFQASRFLAQAPNGLTALAVLLAGLPLLALLCSVVRTVRTRTFTRYTLCHWVLGKPLRWLWGKLKKLIEKVVYILAVDYQKDGGKKFKILSLLAVAGFLILSSLLFFLSGLERLPLLFFLLWVCNGAVFLFAGLLIVSLDRIMAGASQIKQGQLDAKIDTRFMPGFMKQFAADIMSIRDGLNQAVDSAIKDQKMKAELITNVSHDLKTPLTSIVTYVDLLKKCEIEDEDANRYIGILDEKSQRLKTLIEDLVEASKASSGAIELHPVKLNLNEFAAQIVGEHADALEAQGMELILKTPETPVTVTADAQKTSRVMENLFTNISKYGLEGTRVYLDVLESEQFGCMILKNISRFPLDTPAEELTRRFVRGDSARGGEGSGLGLSIADDLCTLQGGQCIVSTDGDLFKVTVALPRA
ncbi:MAG: HAMP domain-containing histidine kinase [Clostridia bacterium]|nr:HAMP domain-containing histidine kinase [Clostridia bacterium]